MNSKTALTFAWPQNSEESEYLDDLFKKLYDVIEYSTQNCDIVLDFGSVEALSPQGLFLLPTFDCLAQESGHRLILKSVPPNIKAILANMSSDSHFYFAA